MTARSLSKAAIAGLVFALFGCSGDPVAVRPAIPTIRAQTGVALNGCYLWSCAMGDCQLDPAIYGACCLQMADKTHPKFPKPSCANPNPNPINNNCGPGTNSSGLYDSNGNCAIQYACCYNPAG